MTIKTSTTLDSVASQINRETSVPIDHIKTILAYLKFDELEKKVGNLLTVADLPEAKELFGITDEVLKAIKNEFTPTRMGTLKLRIAIQGSGAIGTLAKDVIA